MTAVACLRVSLDANRTDIPKEALGPLVAKYTNAFLEVHWSWPRQSEALTHYCYLLLDPRATRLDTMEIARLSEQLEQRLFGTRESGALTLLLFEGEREAVETFSAMSEQTVSDIVEGRREPPPGGELSRIRADGTLDSIPPVTTARAPSKPSGPPPIKAFEGIYFTLREMFIADVLSCTPFDAKDHLSLVGGDKHRPKDPDAFDEACVFAALEVFAKEPPATPIYLPVSFSKLMRATPRGNYAALLGLLPQSMRPALAAAIYDVPRAMSYQALKTVQGVLDPHFSALDLRTADPGFEVSQMAVQAVRSVTLALPEARAEVRLATLRRFGQRADEFKRRRIWLGATDIRTPAERDLAIELRVPFITGPGVCGLRRRPLGGATWAATQLPAPTTLRKAAAARRA